MNGRSSLAVIFLLLLFPVIAGCVSPSIGDVSYADGNMTVAITHTGKPVDAGVQVRIFTLGEFEQHDLLTTGTSLTLSEGGNSAVIPVSLDPGRYKLYVYLTANGEREAAVIRDIEV